MLDEQEAFGEPWRRVLLFAIPIGALAFLLGWLLDEPSGQANPLDRLAYPLLTIGMLALELILLFNKRALRMVVYTIVIASGGFFLIKLVYLLYFASPFINIQAEMTETFYWIPMVYLLSLMIPGLKHGQYAAISFTALALLASTAFISAHLLQGNHLGVIYSLIQLNLANTTLLALTLVFINFKEHYTETRTRATTMERFAYTDLLTKLPNRRWLEDELNLALAQTTRQHLKLGICFIDLDRFKRINDTQGHEAGDLLLKQVAQRLQACSRESDTVARISGDEFVLLARSLVGAQDAKLIAEKVQAVLAEPFTIHGQAITVTASIGISVYPDDGRDVVTLLRHADSAMYYTKHLGRNSLHAYDANVGSTVEARNQLERDLQGALQRGELALHYQPQHELQSGKLVKIEALLRWYHPKLGLVTPSEFISLAEESGLITAIGSWVLQEACWQNAAWKQAGFDDLVVAVNVSPLQFAQPSFFQVVQQALEQSGLDARWLELELTESIVMHRTNNVSETFCKLQRLGVGLAIDDFGTGYSSLSYLRDLPIDTIKIDRSFVDDLSSPRQSPQYALALVQAIVSLARNLDLEVVAEGVENKVQLNLVRDLGCQLGQGEYFSKAMPAHELELTLTTVPTETLSPHETGAFG
ncbi:MAG: EAL domain-containing protein [Deinococcota bacterium]|nr:EAL domain-containing protein [Deinococcota bacterium]